jgi:hypothetical protein
MSYIGNGPDVNAFTIGVDRFNGTGACTEFTLTRDIDDAKAIEVIVNGVQQDPDNAYTVTNGLITFSEAPSSGTDNIIVTYRAPVVVTFNQVTPSQLQANSVTQTSLAPNSVITSKISPLTITGDKIGLNQISGNVIQSNSISSNNIVPGSITGNLIPNNAVSGNNIVPNSIRANNIVAGEIKGNLIGVGSISSNHFVGGGVTSEVLSPNLSVSVARTLETALVSGSGASGTINIDVLERTVHYYGGTTTANVTFNVRGNSSFSFDAVTQIGQTTSVAAIVKNTTGGGGRRVCFLTIDGGTPTIVYAANGRPGCTTTMITSTETNIFTWSILKTGAGTYEVFASNTIFGSA